MATVGRDIESVELTERELWLDGPPQEAFKQMRSKCPVHWTESFEELPDEPGFWSVTTAEDIHTVSRDWQTYSSELGGIVVAAAGFPIELARAMFIGMDPPKHDRLKALFQARLHAQAHRRPRGRHPRDHVRRARPARGSRDLRSRRRRRPAGRLARDRQLHGHLRGGRSDLGETDELDARRRRSRPQPRWLRRRRSRKTSPRSSSAASKLIAERRREPDRRSDVRCSCTPSSTGERLEEHEIVMGFFLLDGRRQRQHQGDLLLAACAR